MLKPLKLLDLATKLDVHISTVSRMFKNKYVQTPYGTVPFKLFLQTNLRNESGEESSILYIKEKIKELVNNEDKSCPLSDETLRRELNNHYSIVVARRTVAKYRDELKIQSSKKRRHGGWK